MSTPNCDNTYIEVAIPGSVLSAKNYSSICFRVGGENCCFPLNPNTYSNTVCKNLLSNIIESPLTCCPPPEPPEPPRPCIDASDISGYSVTVSYAPGTCRSGHRCDRAKFLLYINDTEIGLVNLNNAKDGLPKSTTLTIPGGIISIDNKYRLSLIKDPSIRTAHKGIARIEIKNLTNEVIFDQCLPNDEAVFINQCS